MDGGSSVFLVPDVNRTRAVLVIDASDFPDDYPMIDSKWMYGVDGDVVPVVSPPVQFGGGRVMVAVKVRGKDMPFWVFTDSLSPIPTEATGEIVGGFEIVAGARTTLDMPTLGAGKYDIIRRADK